MSPHPPLLPRTRRGLPKICAQNRKTFSFQVTFKSGKRSFVCTYPTLHNRAKEEFTVLPIEGQLCTCVCFFSLSCSGDRRSSMCHFAAITTTTTEASEHGEPTTTTRRCVAERRTNPPAAKLTLDAAYGSTHIACVWKRGGGVTTDKCPLLLHTGTTKSEKGRRTLFSSGTSKVVPCRTTTVFFSASASVRTHAMHTHTHTHTQECCLCLEARVVYY